MPSGIYAIRNTVNDKAYIGSAADFSRRWGGHKHDLRYGKHTNSKLQRAWDKYGETAFVFEVLMLCDKRYLLFTEQIWLDGQQAVKKGYNVQPVAWSSQGRWQSESTRQKIRDYFTGRPRNLTPEARAAMAEKVRASKLGKKRGEFSAEWRENLSKRAKGRPKTSEHKAKIGAATTRRYAKERAEKCR